MVSGNVAGNVKCAKRVCVCGPTYVIIRIIITIYKYEKAGAIVKANARINLDFQQTTFIYHTTYIK